MHLKNLTKIRWEIKIYISYSQLYNKYIKNINIHLKVDVAM